ncbi:NAD-dependent epimerase/dehydratase family protein [candidate division KSB1 bacterium]|nr:MAG: NAD-dependent epimerase/dehydratase family protein [candidate division KSB1 bacterium]
MQFLRNLRILVTGGAGFIGSHLTETLLANGAQVAVLDNFDPYYPRQEKERNLEAFRNHSNYRFYEVDIRNQINLTKTFTEFRPQVVVHLAARAGVRPSLNDPEGYADVNVRGTAILLEEARKSGIRNFVFASSSSVYGKHSGEPFRETDNTDSPLSPYGATKKSGEALCFTFHHVYGMSISCLRFFTVYGPRQRPDLAIRKFVRLALNGEEIPVYGDGSSCRDYTHIRDILSGIIGAIRWGESDMPRFGIFNLGSSNPILLRELLDKIEKYIGLPLKRKCLPFQPGDMISTFADTTLAQRELGFRHDVLFDDGLREFVEWMKTQNSE